MSASPIELVSRIATALGLEGAVATRSELDEQGRYTGQLTASSVTAQARSSRSRSSRPSVATTSSRCAAYSDSISDLPMMERVGTAVAVNPDGELRELARERGWRVVEVGRKRH